MIVESFQDKWFHSDCKKNILGMIEESPKEVYKKDEILKQAKANNIDFQSVIITNQRHNEILKNAIDLIKNTIKECEYSTVDIIDHLVKEIWQELGKITGESEVENIIDSIFSKFCLGK